MQTTTTIKTKIILKKTQRVEPEEVLEAPFGEEEAAASPIGSVDSSGKAEPALIVDWEAPWSCEEFACAEARLKKREKAQINANVIFETFNVPPTQTAAPQPPFSIVNATRKRAPAEKESP